MTIGQVAGRSGVGVETVRYYERRGMVPRPLKPVAGYRNYPASTVDRILFIRRAKELGFALREIKELLSMRVRHATSCGTVKRRAEAKIDEIETKIKSLRRLKTTLKRLVTSCERSDTTSPCPILETLDRPRDKKGTDSFSKRK